MKQAFLYSVMAMVFFSCLHATPITRSQSKKRESDALMQSGVEEQKPIKRSSPDLKLEGLSLGLSHWEPRHDQTKEEDYCVLKDLSYAISRGEVIDKEVVKTLPEGSLRILIHECMVYRYPHQAFINFLIAGCPLQDVEDSIIESSLYADQKVLSALFERASYLKSLQKVDHHSLQHALELGCHLAKKQVEKDSSYGAPTDDRLKAVAELFKEECSRFSGK